MAWLKTLWIRLRALWCGDRIHNEIAEELQFHIDMRTEENMRRGLEPEEARREARNRFGSFAGVREQGYDVRGGGWLDVLMQDLRFGMRMLLKKPSFTIIAMTTLAMGIGASMVMLTVVNGVLLSHLPFPDPDRLVVLFATSPARGIYRDTTSFPDFVDWKTQSHAFTDLAAYRSDRFNVSGGGPPELIMGLRGSHELFNVLETLPVIGRGFNKEEQEQKSAVAVISHRLWMRRYNGNPDVLGMKIVLNDVPHSIIGVLPQGFQLPAFTETDTVVPVPENPSRSAGYIRGIARLRQGAEVTGAQRELDAIAERLAQMFPGTNRGRGISVVPLHEVAVGDVRTPLLILMGASAFVLLIGCANVGGLVLAKGIARRQELAVRTALGAGTGRLTRQLLTESLLLGLFATLFGTVLAVWGSRILMTSLSARFALPHVTFDWPLLALALCIAVAAGVLCGLPPALMVWRSELTRSFKEEGSGRYTGRTHRLRNVLVVSQTALTIVLLVGAGLLLKSFVLLQQVDPGFDPHNVLTANMVLSKRYENLELRQTFLRELVGSLAGLSGVQHAAVFTDPPFSGGSQQTFTVEGRPDPGPELGHLAGFNVISEDFFSTVLIPLRQGRGFDQQDSSSSIPVAIVNETMVRQFWPKENPIGKRIRLYYDKNREHWLSVVGVVGDIRDRGRHLEARPQVFVPYRQNLDGSYPNRQQPFVSFAVRTIGDPEEQTSQVLQKIWTIDKDQSVWNIQSMEQALSGTVADRRLYLLVLGGFAVIAFLMATAGIYSLISYATATRTQEVGIRIALGATMPQILRLFLCHGLVLLSIGIALGIAGSILLTKLLSEFLYGTTATDPATFLTVTLLFVVVGLIATYIPARRAAKINPSVAFRCE